MTATTEAPDFRARSLHQQFSEAIIAFAAHLPADEPVAELRLLPYFRSFQPHPTHRIAGWLGQMRECAESLARCNASGATKYIVGFAELSIMSGMRALLAATGCPEMTDDAATRREAGRLVVKNCFPRALSFYGAGSYGDFTFHRLPLSGYAPGLHVASAEIKTQAALVAALRVTRKLTTQQVRAAVQANPNTAIRSQKTGRPLDKWTAAHWQQITWRLGYTTAFDLLAAAATHTSELPAGPALLAALTRIVGYYHQVFNAYLDPTYAVVGEAYTVAA